MAIAAGVSVILSLIIFESYHQQSHQWDQGTGEPNARSQTQVPPSDQPPGAEAWGPYHWGASTGGLLQGKLMLSGHVTAD